MKLRGRTRLSITAFTLGLALLCSSCQEVINFPAPAISSINPQDELAGSPAFTLIVTGANFVPSSTVLWNGTGRVTFFKSGGELDAQILAADIQNPGTATVAVTTPSPGGGTTTTLQFTINPAPSPLPQVTSLSPMGVLAGTGQFVLTVTGTNFVSRSIVTANGNNRPTLFTNSTSLSATIFASDVANGGTVQIAVLNPQPNGGASNALPLQVNNPVPSLTTASPATTTAGSAATSVSLTGTGFVPTSVVMFNGSPRTTEFGNSTSLTVDLASGDFLAAGIDQITVMNPAPVGGTSNILPFAVNPTGTVGLPELLDIAPDGTQANAGVCGAPPCAGVPTLATAGPSISGNGGSVAFASTSTNLLLNPSSGTSSIFVRTTCYTASGSGTCSPVTSLVNQTPSGGAPNGPSSEPSLDSTAAHVAYTSTASNLLNYSTVDGTKRQVYWQPICSSGVAGAAAAACEAGNNAAALVSIDVLGNAGNGDSYNPVISPDGRYVAFASLATNLVSGVVVDGITPQVYLRDTCNGVTPLTVNPSCTPVTYLVSSADGITPGNGPSSQPSVANDGDFVSFVSNATNLEVASSVANPAQPAEVFEQTECQITTAGCTPTTILISTPDGVTLADGPSAEPTMSQDGRFVAFTSQAENLISGIGPTQQIYLRDTCTDVTTTITACTPSLALVSTPDGTTASNATSENPSLNSQCTTTVIATSTTTCTAGVLVAFATKASNMGFNITNGVENVYVRKTCAGVAATTTTGTVTSCTPALALASAPAGASPPSANGDSLEPAISGDGHTVSFISAATNLVPNDTNGFDNIFLALTSY